MGRCFQKTPACYGFSIIAKIIPGREENFYEYGRDLAKGVAGTPDLLASLKLHYLRWNLFEIKGDTYFQYMGIFDTDFDKYTEDAVPSSPRRAGPRSFENLEGFPTDWRTNAGGLRQVYARPPVPELHGIRRVSVCQRGRDQEGAEAQGGFFGHARPNAVEATPTSEPG